MPRKVQLDKETSAELNRSKEIADLVKTQGWKEIKLMLINRFADSFDFLSMDTSNPAQLAYDLKVKQAVATELYQWVKDVEGEALKHDNNKALVVELKETYIRRFD